MRVKRGQTTHRSHQKIRQQTRGMTRPHRSSIRRGKQATTRALQFAYRDRRSRKRTFRQLWNARINAAARDHGTTYSRVIAGMKQSNIQVDRKIMAELAVNEPTAFEAILKAARISK